MISREVSQILNSSYDFLHFFRKSSQLWIYSGMQRTDGMLHIYLIIHFVPPIILRFQPSELLGKLPPIRQSSGKWPSPPKHDPKCLGLSLGDGVGVLTEQSADLVVPCHIVGGEPETNLVTLQIVTARFATNKKMSFRKRPVLLKCRKWRAENP